MSVSFKKPHCLIVTLRLYLKGCGPSLCIGAPHGLSGVPVNIVWDHDFPPFPLPFLVFSARNKGHLLL